MAQSKAQWETIGEQFVTKYYEIFDVDRSQLLNFYHETALFTFEENQAQGRQQIGEVLTTKLCFSEIKHIVTKIDCQPTSENGIVILVTGRLKTDNDPPHAYSQLFYIKPFDNSFFIFHDVFRLSLHDI